MGAIASRDLGYMRQALALARRGLGRTAPNPTVGAVVVNGRRILGQGYHHGAGRPHAEVGALRQAGPRARGATLYVTLEPCNHHGRTPPCCDAILAAGVSRVVVGARDPNPITNGRGLARLRRAGVRVVTGVLGAEAGRLNEPFEQAMRRHLPLVIAKVGQSLDGKIATRTGESRWITSPEARRLTRGLRGQVEAILVGVNTVRVDDPLLTARGRRRRADRPIKVIVDSRLRISPRARCLSAASPTPTVIATTVRAPRKRRALERRGAEVLHVQGRGRVPLRPLLRRLARRGLHSVLIEGGGEVLASAFGERLVDRIVWFIAPTLIGGREAPGALGGAGVARLREATTLRDVEVRRVGRDLCVEARVVYPRTGIRGSGPGVRERTRGSGVPRRT